jgi:hypothetical protein
MSDDWWQAYREYLASPEWKARVAAVQERAGGRCEQPGCRRKGRHAHHKHYRNFGNEPLEDLIWLCLPCHQAEHPDKKISGKSPFQKLVARHRRRKYKRP